SGELRRTTCPCSMMEDSPLAQGLADPLVGSHFQVDGVGRWTLPALAGSDETVREGKQAVLDALECTALPAQAPADPSLPEPAAATDAERAIVGPFAWRSLDVDGRPVLAAVREVRTPGSRLRQGFLVDPDALDALLVDAAIPAHVQPAAGGAVAASLPLAGIDWEVALDDAAAATAARAEAAGLQGRFLRTFALGVLFALAAGALTITLVMQAERVARQRSDFAAAAAHELRTPLAGMKLYGEMLAEGSGSPDKRQGYGRRIAEEAGRLGRVVNNVLGYARLERGSLTASGEAGDLEAAVRSAADALSPTLESRGVALRLRTEAPLPAVRCHTDAVFQMLQNLIDNAEKYSREADDRAIDVVLRPHRGGVELIVEDRGPGIPRAMQRRLFKPFSRGASSDAPSGLGLGLAMVRELARAQKAEVTYHDRPEGGARFAVQFPAAAG
ncbi:MAG: HAMP domain-containing histidine kinase, partial [Planctomycetota bacterium]|nr:HAMP domain-containing histidine kinase [Planctomycetota bacterium]